MISGSAIDRIQATLPRAVWGEVGSYSWARVFAQAMGTEMQRFSDAAQWITNQAYPALADENGLSYWEQLLGLPINPINLTTDQRREVVMSRRRIAGPVQIPAIVALIEQYQHGTAVVAWDAPSQTVTVTWSDALGVPPQIADVDRALRKFLPAWVGIHYVYRYVVYSTITNRQEPYSAISGSGETYAQLLVPATDTTAYLIYQQIVTTGRTYQNVTADALTYQQLLTTAPANL